MNLNFGFLNDSIMMISTYFRITSKHDLVVKLILDELQKAKTSSFLVIVGLGSYCAYRLCIKYFGPDFLSSLLSSLQPSTSSESSQDRVLGNSFLQDSHLERSFDVYADDEWSSNGSEETASLITNETFLLYQNDVAEIVQVSCQPSTSDSRSYNSPFRQNHDSPLSANSTPVRKQHLKQKQLSPPRRNSLPHSPRSARKLQISLQQQSKCQNVPRHKNFGSTDSTESGESFQSDSPPPIRRRRPDISPLMENNEPSLISSCPSSVGVNGQFLWDGDCTPGSLKNINESLMKLMQTPAHELDPEQLAKKVYATIKNNNNCNEFHCKNDRRSRSKSPVPSELSLFSELSTGGIQKIGISTAESLERLECDISLLKDGLENLKFEVTDLVERSHCKTDAKHYYRSVVVQPSEFGSEIGSIRSLDIPSVAGPSSRENSPKLTHLDDVKQKLFDSAICTDFASSDSNSDSGILSKSKTFESSLGITPEEPDFPDFDDSPDSRSCSLEWDEFKFKNSSPITVDQNNLCIGGNFELESPEVKSNSDSLFPEFNVKVLNDSENCENPVTTRDLMIFGQERFLSNTPVMKLFQCLGKKKNLRRVGELNPSLCGAAQAVVFAILYHKIPIFKCNTFHTVQEAVDLSVKRCSFLKDWILPQSVRETLSLPNPQSWDSDTVKTAMTLCMKHLWNLTTQSYNLNHITNFKMSSIIIESVKLLMVLKCVEMYETAMTLRSNPRPIYAQLFLTNSPQKTMEELRSAGINRSFTQIELALMSESLGIRLEIFDLESPNPNVGAVYPEKTATPPTVTLLKLNEQLYLPLLSEM